MKICLHCSVLSQQYAHITSLPCHISPFRAFALPRPGFRYMDAYNPDELIKVVTIPDHNLAATTTDESPALANVMRMFVRE